MNKHLFFPALVTLTAIVFLNPWKIFMPTTFLYCVLGILVLSMSLYGILLFKEQVRDEREVLIRSFAHRIGFVVGMVGLVLIIFYYFVTKGHVYPETILLLVFMIIAKSLAHWYGDRNF